MRAMILGTGGMLGHDLVQLVPKGVSIHPFTHAELDVTRCDLVAKSLAMVRPHVLINAAAYTQVDRAESERELAFQVNAEAVGQLAQMAERGRFRLIHFSTDYVFDGEAAFPYSEESETRPINTYGASKLAGEAAVRSSRADYLMIRSQWLFGVHGRSFPRTMWERARSGTPTKVVNDQTGRPTYTHDLARAVWELTAKGVTGIRHIANRGEATWFDVATHIFQHAKKSELVKSCVTADYPTAARRPRYSVLSTGKYQGDMGADLRDWRRALDEFLNLLET